MSPEVATSGPSSDVVAKSLLYDEAMKSGTIALLIENAKDLVHTLEEGQSPEWSPVIHETIQCMSQEQCADVADTLSQQIQEIDMSTAGHQHLQLDPSIVGTGVMGYGQVDGGESTVGLNPAQAVYDPEGNALTIAHELAHVNEQAPIGTLAIDSSSTGVIDAWTTYEGHAQISANEQVGRAAEATHAGQTPEYHQAQERVLELRQVLGEQYDQLFEMSTLEVQRLIWERRLQSGTATFDDVILEGRALGYENMANNLVLDFVSMD